MKGHVKTRICSQACWQARARAQLRAGSSEPVAGPSKTVASGVVCKIMSRARLNPSCFLKRSAYRLFSISVAAQCLAAVDLPLVCCVAARISQRSPHRFSLSGRPTAFHSAVALPLFTQRSPYRFAVPTLARAAVTLPLVYVVLCSGPRCRNHPM
jgi:hypothetical protein